MKFVNVFNFVIGCQVLFECLEKLEENEVYNILIQIIPKPDDIANIFDNIKSFYKGSYTVIPIIAGLLEYLIKNKPDLGKVYMLKTIKWLIEDWSYYPSQFLISKIIDRMYIIEKDLVFFNNMTETLKELIDSFWLTKYQNQSDFNFHSAISSLYLFYLQL